MKTGVFIFLFLLVSSASFAALTEVKPLDPAKSKANNPDMVDPSVLLLDKPEDNPVTIIPQPAQVIDENAVGNKPEDQNPKNPIVAPTPEQPAEDVVDNNPPADQTPDALPDATPDPAPQDPVVEAPIKMDIKDYLDQALAPKYIKINLDGYNIRSSNSFEARDKNIAFKSGDGSVLPVTRVRPLDGKAGASVGVCVGGNVAEGRCQSPGKENFVYVPFGHGADFQFCSSADCFGPNLSEVLTQVGNGFDVTNHGADTCTVNGNDGLAGPSTAGLDSLETGGKPKPEVPSAGKFNFETKPLWEREKPNVGSRWTAMLLDSISKYGNGLVQARKFSDQNRFCPNFSRLNPNQKVEFWVHMFNSIARAESNWNLKSTFDEASFRNVRSGPIDPNTYSQGLFQLSYGSAAQGVYRKFCKFDWRADRRKDVSDPTATIYDPKKQMDCAVGMMNYLVGQDRTIGWNRNKGGARFWSTLRSSNPATRDVINRLKKFRACWE